MHLYALKINPISNTRKIIRIFYSKHYKDDYSRRLNLQMLTV